MSYYEIMSNFDSASFEMIQRDGKISHALGLEESILLKCP